MAFVVVIAMCAVVGALLYLPFLLWFKYTAHGRRQIDKGPKVETAELPAQLLPVLGMLGVMVWYELGRSSTMLDAMHDGAMLKAWLAACVLAALITAVRRRPVPTRSSAVPTAEAVLSPAPVPGAPRGLVLETALGKVPVLIHWQFLLSGAFIAFLAGARPVEYIDYCAAYAALTVVHEAAHALVAQRLGLRVFAIVLFGHTDACIVQPPRSVWHTFLVYAAGVSAQAVLLVVTLGGVAILGEPTTPAGLAAATTFTWVNAMHIVVNLLPNRSATGQQNDGAVLWQLFRHVRHGEPHPLAEQHAASPVFDPSTRLLTVDGMKPDGFVAGIELLNDDTSPMEFVIEMLERHAVLEHDAAVAAMLQVHRRGGLLLPLQTRSVAEVVAEAITRESLARGHSLVCRAVSTAD